MPSGTHLRVPQILPNNAINKQNLMVSATLMHLCMRSCSCCRPNAQRRPGPWGSDTCRTFNLVVLGSYFARLTASNALFASWVVGARGMTVFRDGDAFGQGEVLHIDAPLLPFAKLGLYTFIAFQVNDSVGWTQVMGISTLLKRLWQRRVLAFVLCLFAAAGTQRILHVCAALSHVWL